MENAVCTKRCAGCFFQGRSTGTCDYIFIVGDRRPCVAGKNCTAFVSLNRKDEFMRKPNWDTEEGRRMWMAGKKDEEIADAFGISTGAVTSRRKKYWEQAMTPVRGKIKEPAANGAAPDQTEHGAPAEPPKERFSLKSMEPVPPAAIQDTGAVKVMPARQEESQGAGRYEFNYTAGLQEPADPAAAAEPAPAGEEKSVLVEGGVYTPERKLDIMDVLEAATGHLTGMQAVCTAGAIQHLMYWRYPEDLLRARDHIDYLLGLLQRMEGR